MDNQMKTAADGFISGLEDITENILVDKLEHIRENALNYKDIGKNLDIMFWVAVYRTAEKHRKKLMK